MSSGSDLLANALLVSLTAGQDFTFPAVDLDDPLFDQPGDSGPIYGAVNKIEIDDLTTGVVGGTGHFDQLMTSLKAHLKEEYAANRISGAEYTKAYTSLVTAALQTATQMLLGRDQAYWQALLVQAQAKVAENEIVKARVEIETARYAMLRAQFEAANVRAAFALTKAKLATEDASYGLLLAQGAAAVYTNTNLLPLQKDVLSEQREVQRAQTLNTRTDGTTIVGTVGKQKDLYTQQITSYQRDAETKASKMFVDAWITQKTIDEGILAPTNFTNATLDTVLTKLRGNLALV
jgi:hypothetical protein